MNKKFIKPLVMVIAILLVVVLAAGLIAQTVIKNKAENSAEQRIVVEADGEDIFVNENATAISTKVYAMPANIVFFEARSSSPTIAKQSITVRATVKPENADNQKLTWESDHSAVTVVADANDSHIATITRVGILVDGPVNITVRSVDNPNAYATCKIDQLIGGHYLEFNGGIEGTPSKLVFGNTYTVWGKFTDNTPGCGTILGETSDVYFAINLKSEFMQRIDYYLEGTGYEGIYQGNDYTFDTNGETATLFNSPAKCFYGGNAPEEVFNHAFKLAMNDISQHCTLSVEGSYTYNGKNL